MYDKLYIVASFRGSSNWILYTYTQIYIHTNHIHIPSIYVVVIKTENNIKQKRSLQGNY